LHTVLSQDEVAICRFTVGAVSVHDKGLLTIAVV
jgi:hypothetical protein